MKCALHFLLLGCLVDSFQASDPEFTDVRCKQSEFFFMFLKYIHQLPRRKKTTRQRSFYLLEEQVFLCSPLFFSASFATGVERTGFSLVPAPPLLSSLLGERPTLPARRTWRAAPSLYGCMAINPSQRHEEANKELHNAMPKSLLAHRFASHRSLACMHVGMHDRSKEESNV